TELAVLIAANLAATVLRFLLFRAWVFPDRDGTGTGTGAGPHESMVVATHSPSSPTYQTGGQQPYQPQGPLPQRPTHQPYAQSGTTTTQFRAGEAADGTWRDSTMQLQPVRPHDSDPGEPR
ncbi:glycosyl transferase, partial [Streptomyces sp. NPDC059627]